MSLSTIPSNMNTIENEERKPPPIPVVLMLISRIPHCNPVKHIVARFLYYTPEELAVIQSVKSAKRRTNFIIQYMQREVSKFYHNMVRASSHYVSYKYESRWISVEDVHDYYTGEITNSIPMYTNTHKIQTLFCDKCGNYQRMGLAHIQDLPPLTRHIQCRCLIEVLGNSHL